MSKSTGCRNEPSTSENDTMTMRMRFLFAALTLALAAGSCSREPRTELFNGRDLAGWVCVTDPEGVGDARDAFSVQNGNIRIAGSPFGYMRTEETYDDYRLHVEWRWIGEATNSGIFQRVQAGDRLWPEAVECQLQAGRAGDLLGLGGAKIAGAESNGRVFIKPRSGGECERPAGEWNCAEIVCVGDHIAVCVNGVLQNECTMRMRFLFAALTLALAAGSCSREPRTELFNGRDLAGWVCVTDPEGVGDARDAFSVQNGNIRIAGSPFGYMRTEETYDDYRLHVEWRWIGEATNSGIFQRVQAGDRLWPEAVECQLQAGRAGDLLGLGGAKIAGAESNGRVFIKPRSGGECERPAGEWNCAEIVCVGDHIAVCVNGVLQNECTGSVRSGYIALQSEGGPVEFRNIWLTRLRRGI